MTVKKDRCKNCGEELYKSKIAHGVKYCVNCTIQKIRSERK